MEKNKKAVTLIELMIVLAICGLFLVLVYNFFIKNIRTSHYKGQIKKVMQQDGRLLVERYYMDVQGAYKITSCDDNNLELEVFSDVPSESGFEITPTTIDVKYEFDSGSKTITRSVDGSMAKEYNQVSNCEFKMLNVDLEETSSADEAVCVVLKVEFEEKEEKYAILTSAFMRYPQASMTFGVRSRYGYFESLYDSDF